MNCGSQAVVELLQVDLEIGGILRGELAETGEEASEGRNPAGVLQAESEHGAAEALSQDVDGNDGLALARPALPVIDRQLPVGTGVQPGADRGCPAQVERVLS